MSNPISSPTNIASVSAAATNPSQARQTASNQAAPSRDHISSSTPSQKTFFEKIKNFFHAFFRKITQMFCFCFKEKISTENAQTQNSPHISIPILTNALAHGSTPPSFTQRVQTFETEIEEFCTTWQPPVLSDIEKTQIINDENNPHYGKTKGQAWSENEAAWDQAIRRAGASLRAVLEDVKNSRFTKSDYQVRGILLSQEDNIFFRRFIIEHAEDPQYPIATQKYLSLKEKLINLKA